VIAYEDLGMEAIRLLELEAFPVVVCNDIHGGDLLLEGKEQWRQGGVLGVNNRRAHLFH
jgi:fumarate hydratase subunit beta